MFVNEVRVVADARERAAVLALAEKSTIAWHVLASLIERTGSALRVVRQDWSGFETSDLVDSTEALGAVDDAEIDRHEAIIAAFAERGVTLVTVLDDEYPLNLR